MQTFRAYLQDRAGTIIWAAWIDALHLEEAKEKAQSLCGEGKPAIEIWSATDRRPGLAWVLDPV